MAAQPNEPSRQELLAEISRLQARVVELEINDHYSKIFQTAPIPLAFSSLENGDFLSTNEMFRVLSGFSQEELRQRVDSRGVPINPLLRLQLSSLLPEADSVQKFETILSTKQDDSRFVIVSSQIVEIGGQLCAFNAFHDITEIKEAREDLQRSEEQYRILARNLPDSAVLLYDKELRYIKVDGSALTSNNYSPHWMEGKTLFEVIPIERAKRLEPLYRAALEGREESIEDTLANGKTYWIKSVPVKGEDDEIVAGMIMTQDITQRKVADRLKNEFVSTVSHELRTPLTSIRGSLGLVLGGVAGVLPVQAEAMVEIAYKNSERLVRLINDILDIEKIESGKMVFDMHPTELMPIIDQAIDANKSYAEQLGVKLVLEEPIPQVRIMADDGRLQQVLANLISNAAKFSLTGGEVLVLVRKQEGAVRVSVTDHGAGISEEFSKNIFQKFAQADTSATRQKGGTGLGLSISRAIVEKHNGQIGYESQPGIKTTFFFEIPEYEDRFALLDKATPAGQSRLLICEDDADVATLLKVMLNEAGFSGDIAYNAEQARELLKSNTYAALTLDLILPGLNGMGFIQELRKDPVTRELPIIVISVKGNESRQSLEGFQPPLIEWIDKPIDQNHLREALARLVPATKKENKPLAN